MMHKLGLRRDQASQSDAFGRWSPGATSQQHSPRRFRAARGTESAKSSVFAAVSGAKPPGVIRAGGEWTLAGAVLGSL